MRTTNALSLLLAATVITACDARETDDTATTDPGQEMSRDGDQPTVPDEMMLSVSEFEPVGNAPTGAVPVRGTAELRRVTDDGSLELHVRVEGLGDEDRAWHIHEGACGSPGAIVVPLSGAQGQDGIAGDLDPDNGVAEQRVTIDARRVQTLDLSRAHSVNVHAGPGDNPGAPIACANIGGSSNTAGATGTGGTTGAPAPARTGY